MRREADDGREFRSNFNEEETSGGEVARDTYQTSGQGVTGKKIARDQR